MKSAALKEAIVDTLLALLINFPLNMGLIAISRYQDMSIFWSTVFFTAVFTVVAIVRKTYMRIYFEKKNLKKYTENF